MEKIVPPGLDDDLGTGHTQQCLALSRADFPELEHQILSVAGAVNQRLKERDIAEGDPGFYEQAGYLTTIYDDRYYCFGGLLEKLSQLQGALKGSNLPNELIQEIWKPIATCYAAVVDTLRDFTPLDQRPALEVGSIVALGIKFYKHGRTVIVPEWKFAIMRTTSGKYTYLEDLKSVLLANVPEEVERAMAGNREPVTVQDVPLKITSAEPGFVIRVEITPEGLPMVLEALSRP